MDYYHLLRLVHIVSAAILFGTGLGIAFFMWQAHRGGDIRVVASVARDVVVADFIFTLCAVIVQFVTGYLLARTTGLSLMTPWVLSALILYLVIGACWLPVVWLQLKVRDIASEAAAAKAALPTTYYRYMRLWFVLGWPALISMLLIFWLMVYKPSW